MARSLLEASTLCAIATVSPNGRAHVNTAYFSVADDLVIVWLSAPQARHSRNIRASGSTAIAVFDPRQTWGEADRGIQLFGTARELAGRAAREAAAVYARRFRATRDLHASYRYYRLRPSRLKLFDEPKLGGATFVSARVRRGGLLEWVKTERYV